MIKKLITKQFFQYLIIGVIGTGLDFLFLYLLVEFLHLFYILAAIISVAIVLWFSFTLNKYWTFRNKDKRYFYQLFKYLISHSIGIAVNLIILTVLVEIFGLWYFSAKIFATAVSVIWNFIITKQWVFASKKS